MMLASFELVKLRARESFYEMNKTRKLQWLKQAYGFYFLSEFNPEIENA